MTPRALAPPMRLLPALPIASWIALVAAALLDPRHRVLRDYVSWLSAGPWAPLAAVAILGLVASTMLVVRHLQATLPVGRLRTITMTFLVCAAVLGVATIGFPSVGRNEPVARTALHVGLAVAAYEGVAVPALLLAWLARGEAAARAMVGWALAIVAALVGLGVVSTALRLGLWDVDLRGAAQLVLAGTSAGWMAAVLAWRPATAVTSRA